MSQTTKRYQINHLRNTIESLKELNETYNNQSLIETIEILQNELNKALNNQIEAPKKKRTKKEIKRHSMLDIDEAINGR